MPRYTQAGRPISVATPLGPDALLLEALTGEERLSGLFHFDLDLLAEPGQDVPFEKLLGQPVSVALWMTPDAPRYVNGIVGRFGQGGEVRGPDGDVTFVRYRATVVPPLWLLTRRAGSRIFQQKTVPQILKEVLAGLDLKVQLLGTYEPRDYCVQYRETDFAFASRLMEEEGIFYYFLHPEGGHTLVLADHPGGHPVVPGPATLTYDPVEGGLRNGETRVFAWEKTQEVRPGQVTLWDHCFELPHKPLDAPAKIQPTVAVGGVTHDLRAGGGDQLEVYDYPGGYAQRFDGVAPGGGDRAADVQKIFADNARTTKLRMEQEAARGLAVAGASECRQLTAGHAFDLTRHFNADGKYVLTRVEHTATVGDGYGTAGKTGGAAGAAYTNRFECLPAALPYRPERATPRPVISGAQTAVVVGPPGEEIFTDKYGRVKVQFHWDRQGKHDADSSCWVRVSQVHAGKNWGGIDIPRIAEEVVVAFEEGDPDRPLVVGRVYNAREMPPFGLPATGMVSGLKSNTYPGGGGSNELSMDDTKGKERMYVHAQYNQDEVVEHDQTTLVKNDRTATVGNDESSTVVNNRTAVVGVDQTEQVGSNQTETIGVNQTLTVGSNQTETVGSNQTVTVGSNQTVTVGANQTNTVGSNQTDSVGVERTTSVGMLDMLNVGLVQTVTAGIAITITAGVVLTLAAPGGTIVISPSGIEISGKKIVIKGDTVHINP